MPHLLARRSCSGSRRKVSGIRRAPHLHDSRCEHAHVCMAHDCTVQACTYSVQKTESCRQCPIHAQGSNTDATWTKLTSSGFFRFSCHPTNCQARGAKILGVSGSGNEFLASKRGTKCSERARVQKCMGSVILHFSSIKKVRPQNV
jgi:hypothetical protein